MKDKIKKIVRDALKEACDNIEENESSEHKKLKNKEAKKIKGETEVPIKGGKRLDAASNTNATEVELSGNYEDGLKRLKLSDRKKLKIIVPEKDVEEVRELAKKNGIDVKIEPTDNSKSKK